MGGTGRRIRHIIVVETGPVSRFGTAGATIEGGGPRPSGGRVMRAMVLRDKAAGRLIEVDAARREPYATSTISTSWVSSVAMPSMMETEQNFSAVPSG